MQPQKMIRVVILFYFISIQTKLCYFSSFQMSIANTDDLSSASMGKFRHDATDESQ
jgi:hypothetical protein